MNLRIRCAVCDKPVDDWTVWDEPAQRRNRIVARCHGAEDEMTISYEDIHAVGRNALLAQEGVAFQAGVAMRESIARFPVVNSYLAESSGS